MSAPDVLDVVEGRIVESSSSRFVVVSALDVVEMMTLTRVTDTQPLSLSVASMSMTV